MSASPVRRDFPDWLGPMLVKELRQGIKSRSFLTSFIALQAIFVTVSLYHALLFDKDGAGFDAGGLTFAFWATVGGFAIIAMPLRALNELASERKANTLELIYMTGLTPWRIVLGKWASMMFQVLLFVIAILPYGVLRYFFGGINITDELLGLVTLLLISGATIAAALAISGMPAFFRGAAVFVAIFGSFSVVSGLMIAVRFSGFSWGASSATGSWANWIPLLDLILICLLALEAGAATIAPPAENHAMRLRLLTLAFFIPAPFLWGKTAAEFGIPQTVIFGFVAALVTAQGLSQIPAPLKSHFRRFRRFGRFGMVLAAPFLPGWPSAVVFLALVEGMVTSASCLFPDARDGTEFAAYAYLIGGTLLTPIFIWALFRRKRGKPLLEQVTILTISFAAAAMWRALKDSRVSLGDRPYLAFYPPFGLLMMQDTDVRELGWAQSWASMSGLVLVILLTLLTLLAVPRWRQMFAVYRSERVESAKQPAPEGAAA